MKIEIDFNSPKVLLERAVLNNKNAYDDRISILLKSYWNKSIGRY